MALILNIETATAVCSVALARDGQVIFSLNDTQQQSHARMLTTLVENCVSEAGYSLHKLDAIAVSKGPGSFTGLRIGVATAKGLCYALNLPLIGIDTLYSMASTCKSQPDISEKALFCPMIDARRMEIYTAVFDYQLKVIEPVSAKIIDEVSFSNILKTQVVVFFGDGMPKSRETLSKHHNSLFFSDFTPSATGMCNMAEQKFTKGETEDLVRFEPFYLKEFYSPLKK